MPAVFGHCVLDLFERTPPEPAVNPADFKAAHFRGGILFAVGAAFCGAVMLVNRLDTAKPSAMTQPVWTTAQSAQLAQLKLN